MTKNNGNNLSYCEFVFEIQCAVFAHLQICKNCTYKICSSICVSSSNLQKNLSEVCLYEKKQSLLEEKVEIFDECNFSVDYLVTKLSTLFFWIKIYCYL